MEIKMMKKTKIIFLAIFLTLPLLTFADIPVEDASNNGAVQTQDVNMPQPTDENSQLSQLQQQVQYLRQLNIDQKIQQLQQSVQDLRGLIEVQGHELDQLQKQQRDQFSDLDARIGALEDNKSSAASQPTSVAAPVNIPQQTASGKELDSYQSAFKLIQNKQYSDAINSLKNYLQQYPQGGYVSNVHYWLGEVYAISGDNDQAISELNNVVKNYPQSTKAPDALLKLGSLAYDQSNYDQAKQSWNQLIKQYPNSVAARVANQHLQQLQQSGN